MNRKNNACRVMISNIPDYMEPEDIRPIFEEVGPVKSLEFVYHANISSGAKKHKHKGYGFCEYFDVVTKDAAVQKLGQRTVNGVVLRVKPADGGKDMAVKEHEAQQKTIPRLELEATTPIAMRLKELSLSEIYEAMEQMKQLVNNDEQRARSILKSFPQLSMAFLHIFYYMGIIRRDPEGEQAARMKDKERRAEARARGELPTRKRSVEATQQQPAPSAEPAYKKKKDPKREAIEREITLLSNEEIETFMNLDEAALAELTEEERVHFLAVQQVIKQNPDKYLKK